jgi:hypothetical protein
MYVDQLPSVRISEMHRSAALPLETAHVTVTIQGGGGTTVSTEVAIFRLRMRSGGVFLQFICGHCGRRAQVLRLHAGRIMCGRVLAIGAKASQRFVALSIGLSG